MLSLAVGTPCIDTGCESFFLIHTQIAGVLACVMTQLASATVTGLILAAC
jgi:hypothetical protein